ncbi:hypothetical protein [Granulicella sp. S156]|uniref:hypothetical protein n=1 Tax=Granulicella sp. S156 TaxID=1747224 RepID=UPI00131BFAF1|nr:hypothetical protein [Granulicella sp. S156]
MASAEKVRTRILELAAEPKDVTLADIDWVMHQLKQFGEVETGGNAHMKIWRFEDTIFVICIHKKEFKQLKAAYIKDFLNAMIKTGWYE